MQPAAPVGACRGERAGRDRILTMALFRLLLFAWHGMGAYSAGEWMRLSFHLVSGTVTLVLFCGACRLPAQTAEAAALPDAPQAQLAALASPANSEQQAPPATQNPPPPANGGAQTSSQQNSSSQTDPTEELRKQREKAEEQLKQQEKQRVMGVMAAFNTTSNQDAVPLSSGQKFKLFFRSNTDPWPFLLTAVVAGIGQAENSNPTWGQGLKGYGKRYGAGYGDYFIGNLFGNAILTSALREDPRYFQKGSGNPWGRFLWAAGSTVWCKRDNGTWGPNYANVGGNMIGAAIGRFYYPASGRTVLDTITDGLTVSAEGIVGAEVIEFWPDLVRRHRRKQAEKLARAQAAAEQKAPEQKDKQQ